MGASAHCRFDIVRKEQRQTIELWPILPTGQVISTPLGSFAFLAVRQTFCCGQLQRTAQLGGNLIGQKLAIAQASQSAFFHFAQLEPDLLIMSSCPSHGTEVTGPVNDSAPTLFGSVQGPVPNLLSSFALEADLSERPGLSCCVQLKLKINVIVGLISYSNHQLTPPPKPPALASLPKVRRS